MRKLVSFLALGAAAALVFAAFSSAHAKATVYHFRATLNASQEVPKQVVKNAAGKGSFTGTLTGTKLVFTLTFSGLTGKATAAHIHLGKMGAAGNVAVPLCTPCKSPVKGTAIIPAGLLKTILKHGTYVNVHTGKNPNGEIRGQLTASAM